MNLRRPLAAIALLLVSALAAAPAAAQPIRTWVASNGDDADPCSRFAPCRSFARAHFVTAAGGEINCVDPGGFGQVTLSKSMTIDCGGMFGSSLATASSGIVIDDSGTADPGRIVVTLRNLSINGGIASSTTVAGIRFVRGARLNVERVTIFNVPGNSATTGFGILIDPSAGSAQVHVADSVIRNNGTDRGGGIGLAPTGSAFVRLTIDNVQLSGNFRGIDARMTGTTRGSAITLSNSRITGSREIAINAATNANALRWMIDGVRIADNRAGIVAAGAGARIRIGNSTIAGNGNAFSAASGATIESFRTNQIGFNDSDGPPLPPVPPG